MPRVGMTTEEIKQYKENLFAVLDKLIEREKKEGTDLHVIYSQCKRLFNIGLFLTPLEYDTYIRHVCKKIPY